MGRKEYIPDKGFKISPTMAVGGGLDAGLEYWFRRQENPEENQLKSLGIAGATAAAWALAPHVMWAKTGAEIGGSLLNMGSQLNDQYNNTLKARSGANFGGNFQDSQIGATMRQRGVAAIQNNKLNARSALGGEARRMHRY